jgi:hypothetical protein
MDRYLTFQRKYQGQYQVGVQELQKDSFGNERYVVKEIRTFKTEVAANAFAALFAN